MAAKKSDKEKKKKPAAKTTKKKTDTKKKSTSKKKTTTKKKTAASKKSTTNKGTSKKKSTTKKGTSKKKAAPKTSSKSTKTTKKTTGKTSSTKKTTKKAAADSSAPKPKRKNRKTSYTKKELEHFKKIINKKRDEILDQLQNLRDRMMDPTTGEYINENSPYSLHMAEQGTDAQEREKTFLYAQRENKFLGYLEDALKRIEAGTYGLCIECIDEPQGLCDTCPLIDKKRLEAVPHSQHCLPIKKRQEKKKLF